MCSHVERARAEVSRRASLVKDDFDPWKKSSRNRQQFLPTLSTPPALRPSFCSGGDWLELVQGHARPPQPSGSFPGPAQPDLEDGGLLSMPECR